MVWSDPTVPSWVRWLEASWRVGALFGVEVRVHWTTILVPLVAWSWFAKSGLEGGGLLALVLIHTVGLYLVIWAHEMGHIAMGRRHGIQTSLITLSPLGGLAHLQAPAPSPKAEILVSAAGPATHLAWLAVLWPLSLVWTPESIPAWYALHHGLGLNRWLLLFNLLPFFPMDGGRVLRSLLALRWHPNLATLRAAQVGTAGAVLFILFGIWRPGIEGGFLIAIGISNLLACRREIAAARTGEGPYGEARQPWESDPEAWKRGFSADGAEDRVESRKAEKLRLRQVLEAQMAAEEKARFQAELDRLLLRVSEVGIAGLTPDERRALDRASEKLRPR